MIFVVISVFWQALFTFKQKVIILKLSADSKKAQDLV